MKNELVLT